MLTPSYIHICSESTDTFTHFSCLFFPFFLLNELAREAVMSTENTPRVLSNPEDAKKQLPPEEEIKLLKPMVGTSMARFLNQYNPHHDKPYERPNPNQGLYLDPELTKLLEEERKSAYMAKNHKRKDWMKSYMDEWVKFSSITKGK